MKDPVPLSGRSASVFVHHDGALGDVLLSLQALRLLRDSYGTLRLAARRDVADLLRSLREVTDTHDPGSAVFSAFYGDRPDKGVKGFLRGFERVFLFTARPEGVLAVSMRQARPDTDVVVTIPPTGVAVPVSGFRLQQAAERLGRDKGLPGPSGAGGLPAPVLRVPEEERAKARRFLSEAGWDGWSPAVVLHPGSGGRRKCWPLERYLECGRHLVMRRGAFLCFVSGPAEEDCAQAIDSFVDSLSRSAVHAKNEGLLPVAALLSCGSLYVGNDSGITHLAGLAGCPAVVVFGPTDPRLWRPSGEAVRVVNAACECAPCGDDRSRECPDRRCLSLVSAEDVVREIEGLLQPEGLRCR